MVEKIKAFSQSDMMQVYKAIIGTGVFIAILFIGGLLVEMRDTDKEFLGAIQELTKHDVGMSKEILYLKRDVAEIAKCATQNRKDVQDIKTDLIIMNGKL